MVFPVIGGDGKPTGYEIDNSMRFNRGDAACLRKTFSGSPTSTKICTISFWTKLADPSNTDAKAIFSAIKSGSNEDVIKFMGVNNGILNGIEINFNNTGDGSMMISSGSSTLIKFRDPSAWYHIVIAIDSSQGTASNRVKVYVNGTQFDTEARVEGGSVADDVALSQNYELGFLTASAHSIGENVESAGNEPYDGYLADFHFVDGSQLAPTAFAETDDNGVWIPKDCKGDLTYGNYGFFLEFQQTGTSANASGKGADTSGNDNHFDDANATAEDITVDTPTNNFATLNPIDTGTNLTRLTFSEGNTKIVKSGTTSSNGDQPTSSQGFANGKWYWEVKVLSNADNTFIGIFNDVLGGLKPYHNNYAYGIYGGSVADGSVNGTQMYLSQESSQKGYGLSQSGGTAFSDNDILQFAFDTSTYRLYLGLNGQWTNNNSSGSAAPTGGSAFNQSTPTGYFEVPTTAAKAGTWRTVIVPAGSSQNYSAEFNFGNPSFSISSGNADANGYGNFEYAVPSGYYSLNTKNLAQYG